MAPPRKVLLVTADQWRGDALSLVEKGAALVPNLARLAAEGVTFARHSTVTVPCGPARSSLLTSLYAFNHRSVTNGTPLDSRFTNLGLEARRLGRDPVVMGYTDTSMDPDTTVAGDPRLVTYEGVMPGFKAEALTGDTHLARWATELARKGYPVDRGDMSIYRHVGTDGTPLPRFSRGPTLWRAEDLETAFVADKVLDYLHFRRDVPWFVHAVFLAPHPPLIAPAPYNTMVDASRVAPPRRRPSIAEERAVHPFLDAWLADQDRPDYFESQCHMQRQGPDEIQAARAVYLGLIAEVDAQLGRILDHLRKTGELDQTLVLFTSDHGEMLGDHWCWGKGGWFEPAYHIPLVVRAPDMPPEARGRVVTAPTESIDLAPTVLDWLGGRVPASWDGRSLRPWLQGETPAAWRDHVIGEADFRTLGAGGVEGRLGLTPDQSCLAFIRGRRYKYVHFPTLPPLLYDLAADPHETRDLAGDPAHAAILAAGARRLLSHRMLHAERTWTTTKLEEPAPRAWSGDRGFPPADAFTVG